MIMNTEELSILIAKTAALAYLSIGVGILLNGSYYKRGFEKIVDNFGMLFISGIMALVVGYMIVLYHNIWEKDWRLLITLFGYAALIKGMMLLAFPSMLSLYKPLLKLPNIDKLIAALALLLGGVLAYFGFYKVVS